MGKSVPNDEGKPCTKNGMMCDGCQFSYYCIQISNGDWNKILMDTCHGKRTCDQTIGVCTDDFNFFCHESVLSYQFVCNQPGIFPDAYDCTKYHLCAVNQEGHLRTTSIDFKCPEGFGFDSMSTLCHVKLTDGKCKSNLPICEKIGQTGEIVGNPSLYYVCMPLGVNGKVVYLPEIFVCPYDTYYVQTNEYMGKCEALKTGLIDGNCVEEGLFYNQDNCESYIQCSKGEVEPISKHCPFGEKFNPIKRICLDHDCSSLI